MVADAADKAREGRLLSGVTQGPQGSAHALMPLSPFLTSASPRVSFITGRPSPQGMRGPEQL